MLVTFTTVKLLGAEIDSVSISQLPLSMKLAKHDALCINIDSACLSEQIHWDKSPMSTEQVTPYTLP